MLCKGIKRRKSKKYSLCIYADIFICDTFLRFRLPFRIIFLQYIFLFCTAGLLVMYSFSFPLCDIFTSTSSSFLKVPPTPCPNQIQNSTLTVVQYFQYFQDVLESFLVSIVSDKKQLVNQMIIPLYVMSFSSCCFQVLLFIFRFQQFDQDVPKQSLLMFAMLDVS